MIDVPPCNPHCCELFLDGIVVLLTMVVPWKPDKNLGKKMVKTVSQMIFFWSKQILGQNFFGQKIFGQIFFWTNFLVKQIFCDFFSSRKQICGQKYFFTKNIYGQSFFNWEGLTQGQVAAEDSPTRNTRVKTS